MADESSNEHDAAAEAARQLTDAADRWAAGYGARHLRVGEALERWTGPAADRAAAALRAEATRAAEVVDRLLAAAEAWRRLAEGAPPGDPGGSGPGVARPPRVR